MTEVPRWGWLAAGAALALGARAAVRAWRRRDLSGRVVIVTGGSRGLGFVLAEELLARGARVAICGRDGPTLERAVLRLAERGDVLAVACDLTVQEECERLVGAVLARFGRVDVLVNNAGRIEVGPLEHMTTEDLEAELAIYVRGPWWCTRAVLPGMIARGDGRIVNISSIGGRFAAPHLLAYTVGKFGLTGLSRGLRVELLPHGVGVTTVFPGLMNTGSPLHALYKGRHREEYGWFFAADSMPGLAVPVRRAARRIVRAVEIGEAEVVIGLPAKVALLLHGLWPAAFSTVSAGIGALLPGPGDGRAVHGRDVETHPTWPMRLGLRAAQRTNETNGV